MLAQKGGTGKTTLAVHLAVEALREGAKVLLVDIDPQASATRWWRRRAASQPDLVQGDGDALPRLLAEAEHRGYDLAIVDTAPHSSQDATISARLSDRVCIPTRPAILDLDAIGASTEIAQRVEARATIVLNACPPPTRAREPRIVAEAREALETYGLPICRVAVSQRASFAHALIDGRVAGELEAGGKAAAEIERLWATLEEDRKRWGDEQS